MKSFNLGKILSAKKNSETQTKKRTAPGRYPSKSRVKSNWREQRNRLGVGDRQNIKRERRNFCEKSPNKGSKEYPRKKNQKYVDELTDVPVHLLKHVLTIRWTMSCMTRWFASCWACNKTCWRCSGVRLFI